VNHPDQDDREPAPRPPDKRRWIKPALEVIPMKEAMTGMGGPSGADMITNYS
jgi:hypothetical protein